jgi:hypothetical protein
MSDSFVKPWYIFAILLLTHAYQTLLGTGDQDRRASTESLWDWLQYPWNRMFWYQYTFGYF